MNARRTKVLVIAATFLALVGVVDSVALTWDHQVAQVDPAGQAGICQRGSACDISRYSQWSEIHLPGDRPGLPIALLGLGFYVAVLGLAWQTRRKPTELHARRLILGGALLGTLYAITLGVYSIVVIGGLCKFCSILYAVNILLLGFSVWARAEPLTAWLRGVWGTLLKPITWVAAALFATTVAAGYVVYAGPVDAAHQRAQARQMDKAREVGATKTYTIDTTGRPSLGDPAAPVHIIEFADFECPHCAKLYETLHALVQERPHDLRVTFMNFPLDQSCNPALSRPFHRRACALAFAAECAHAQGKWADVAGWLFRAGRGASDEDVVAQMERAGLDLKAFQACVLGPAPRQQVAKDLSAGVNADVQATPTFFVNGHRVEGGRPRAVVEAMIDAVLKGGGAGDAAPPSAPTGS